MYPYELLSYNVGNMFTYQIYSLIESDFILKITLGYGHYHFIMLNFLILL